MTQGPSPEDVGDRWRVTPLGARRRSVADLQGEVERLTEALRQAEERRRTAERTLADMARMAAADAADLRRRLDEAEARLAAVAAAAPKPGSPEAGADPSPAPGRRRRGPVRRAALAAALLIGVLLVTDGILTITWQEPYTAWRASRTQDALRDDLAGLQRTFADAPRLQRESDAARMHRLAVALLRDRKPGQAVGRLEIPKIGLKTVVVQGTGTDDLKKGPGHYSTTLLPGLRGTVGLAGHRTTYGAPFRHIDDLHRGSRIIMKMPYGTFTYRVIGTEITTADDTASLRPRRNEQRLVLTACHPLYSAAQRIVVSARLVSSRPTAGRTTTA